MIAAAAAAAYIDAGKQGTISNGIIGYQQESFGRQVQIVNHMVDNQLCSIGIPIQRMKHVIVVVIIIIV